MQITGIILSGGKSTRMGTDKALIQIDGKTLLDKAIETCRQVCHSILISSNHPRHEKSGCKTIPDKIENCGPIGGICSCLKQSQTDWNFVISVDAAFVEAEFASFITSEIDDVEAIVPCHNAGKEPLVALYHKSSLAEMEKMIGLGDFKMHNLLKKLKTKYVDSQVWVERFPDLFRNLNRPDEL
jgi:molybdopterin-guanine dinucleotide biosynthesis protein A